MTNITFCANIVCSKVGFNASSEKKTGSCFFYERHYSLRYCFRIPLLQTDTLFIPFCSNLQKGFFIMNKNFLRIRRLTTRELCTLAMLLGITVLMGMFFTFRIGDSIKIPTKFLPIAVSAMLFGPFWGGILGILADILAYFVQPVGAFMPQITFVEFLYGFTYGLFLCGISRNAIGFLRAYLCVFFQVVLLHFFLTSYLLMPLMGGLSYYGVLAYRAVPALINLCLQLVGITFTVIFSPHLKKLLRRQNNGL